MKVTFSILISLIAFQIFAIEPISQREKEESVNRIVKFLNDGLVQDYLPEVNRQLGECTSGNEKTHCLQTIDQYQVLETTQKNICFPSTNCHFYKCMEKTYQCESQGVDYFTNLAFPTCSQYVSNIDQLKFSRVGIEWIYSVMVCLQKGLVDECEVLGNCSQGTPKKSCQYIVDFTLKFHPGCYINSGVGVCRLPLKDKIQIWKTVRPFLTKNERKEAYKVIFHCLKNGF